MKCPKCDHRMRCTNGYRVPGGSALRYECGQCQTVVTAHAIQKIKIVAIDPEYGEGAAALAKRLRKTDNEAT